MIELKHLKGIADVSWSVAEHMFKLIAWGIIVAAARTFIPQANPNLQWVDLPLSTLWLAAYSAASIKMILYCVTKTDALRNKHFTGGLKGKLAFYAAVVCGLTLSFMICYYTTSTVDQIFALVLPIKAGKHPA